MPFLAECKHFPRKILKIYSGLQANPAPSRNPRRLRVATLRSADSAPIELDDRPGQGRRHGCTGSAHGEASPGSGPNRGSIQKPTPPRPSLSHTLAGRTHLLRREGVVTGDSVKNQDGEARDRKPGVCRSESDRRAAGSQRRARGAAASAALTRVHPRRRFRPFAGRARPSYTRPARQPTTTRKTTKPAKFSRMRVRT